MHAGFAHTRVTEPTYRNAPGRPANPAPHRLIDDVRFGEDVVVHSFVNLYGCSIGSRTKIGAFVEVQRGAAIGSDCKIESHTFICDGVTIRDRVFVGHGVVFVNDKHPRATGDDGALKGDGDWEMATTIVESGAALGSGAVVLGGVRIGQNAMVGAGAVVTRDVPDGRTFAGNPARPIRPETPRR
jgi:UDP-2-acetamido-3-amino-2,3-dideoxy-glucuronate N-acetyltransferase